MPRGTNMKALEARERKKAAADAKKETEVAAKEAAKWEDNDKHAKAALDRKAAAKAKLDLKNLKKSEMRQLEAAESEALNSITTIKSSKKASKGSNQQKVTQGEISQRTAGKSSADGKSQEEKASSKWIEEDLLLPNPNQELQKIVMEAKESNQELIIASGLEETLEALKIDNAVQDKHPERRMKAAHLAFEEKMMPIFRQENPTFTRSQLKQLVWKKWLTSPENPHNQA